MTLNREIKIKDHIEYDDIRHTYRNMNTNEYYTSVTRWINNIKYRFIANESKTYKTQQKLGISHEEVLKLWGEKNLKSTIRGTAIHHFIEDILVDGVYGEIDVISDNCKGNIISYLKDRKLLGKRGKKELLVEDIVYNDELKLAGQADLPIMYKRYGTLTDWKSNDKPFPELMQSYKYYKEVFTEFKQCSYMDYVIQLCIYAIFLERMYNKPITNLYIVHIQEDVIEHEIPEYLKKEVINKLKHLWNLNSM